MSIARDLAAHYNRPLPEVQEDLATFIGGLVREKLIVPAPLVATAAGPATGFQSAQYEAPQFEKFEDMADQLLLDKIEDENQQAVWVTDTPVVGP